MKRGILLAMMCALAGSSFLQGCRNPPDTAQLRTVDSLITVVDAAMLTLNELDRSRYTRTDSLFQAQSPLFAARFADTLDRATADALANQFITLRSATTMARDHEQVLTDLGTASERLRALRLDLQNGTMKPTKGKEALLTERAAWSLLETNLLGIIDNYRMLQRTWDNVASIDPMIGNDTIVQ